MFLGGRSSVVLSEDEKPFAVAGIQNKREETSLGES